MEKQVLQDLALATTPLDLPGPVDLRRKLPKTSGAHKWKLRNVKGLKGLVWHQELGWGSIEAVANYHTGSTSHLRRGGVESIAYSWAIRRDGQIALCNNLNKATWSQGYRERSGDENSEFMAVMFEGLFVGEGVTDPSAGFPNDLQMLAGLTLWQICKRHWSWTAGDLYGHFLFGKPACPGHTLQTVVDAVRANHEPEEAAQQHNFQTVEGRQQALKDLGFYTAAVDGIWGPGSKTALTNFQKAAGLEPDGVWGPKSESAIRRALAQLA